MSVRTVFSNRVFLPLFLAISLQFNAVSAADGVTLYTPYTKVSVPPGESIDYSIDIINKSDATKNVEVWLSGLPNSWTYALKAGGWNIKQLSILPGEKKTLSLKVEVPLKVNKGNYQFKVVANNYDALLLTVNVSEQGTFKTEFTTDQANMEGHAKSTFTYKTKLKNRTGDKQLYSLRSNTPPGWQVTFKPNYKQATSVEIEPNASSDISIEITPPINIASGTYKIPVSAVTNTSSANLELEVVVTGSYDIELTTPTGLLSTSITAGDTKRIELVVKNTGSADLNDIDFSASSPSNWEVVFEPQKIDRLKAGENTHVFATIKADKKAITGDYVTTLTAKTFSVSSKAAFRISVKTPMLWGWVGILIILGALGSVYYLFRKYGRR
jgi:uncharacterized membrane protein